MTIDEEIQKYTDELAQQYFPNEHNILARKNIVVQFVVEACVRMAKHIEQGLIEKACAWLKKELIDNRDNFGYNVVSSFDTFTLSEFIEEFKKAMEE